MKRKQINKRDERLTHILRPDFNSFRNSRPKFENCFASPSPLFSSNEISSATSCFKSSFFTRDFFVDDDEEEVVIASTSSLERENAEEISTGTTAAAEEEEEEEELFADGKIILGDLADPAPLLWLFRRFNADLDFGVVDNPLVASCCCCCCCCCCLKAATVAAVAAVAVATVGST